jgi:cytochrome c553
MVMFNLKRCASRRGWMRGLPVMRLCLCLWMAAAGLPAPAWAADTSDDLSPAQSLQGDVARGKAAFETCIGCHRKDASGRAADLIPRLSGQHASVIIKQVADIRAGRRLNPPMKPFVDGEVLNAQALADIAVYLQALPMTGTLGKGPGTGIERGKQLYERDCAACHGPQGEGIAALAHPMVAAQHYRYLLRELALIRDGLRGNSNPAMLQLVKTYAEADLEAVADHMAQLPAPSKAR